MRKILTIAAREYRAMVGTKAFLFSVGMMPLLMFGSLIAINMLEEHRTIEEKRIAIVDQSGFIFGPLNLAASASNQMLETNAASGEQDSDERAFGQGGHIRYVLEQVPTEGFGDAQRLQLSERVRKQELFGYVEIPADVADPANDVSVSFHSQDSGLSEVRQWIAQAISEIVKAQRMALVGLNPEVVAKATKPVKVRGLGLVEESPQGAVLPATEKDELSAVLLPMGVLMLMFMVIFLAAQPMLESVLEEKSQRIAEVLLGSANPTQLMAGKLIGTVAGSLTVFAIYFAGVFMLGRSSGWLDRIPFHLAPWFVVFQVLGVLFFAAIFMAVGASVSQLKEAQSLLLPVWMLMMIPMFVWLPVVREPNGPLAVGLSMFPPATPTMMMLRMSTGATIPTWQPLVGILILILATILCVYIAGRIFRVGILWQGKTPKLTEIARWAIQG